MMVLELELGVMLKLRYSTVGMTEMSSKDSNRVLLDANFTTHISGGKIMGSALQKKSILCRKFMKHDSPT
jgi:hypothetical protein